MSKGWTAGQFESKVLQKVFKEVIEEKKKLRSFEEKVKIEGQKFFSLKFMKIERLRFFFFKLWNNFCQPFFMKLKKANRISLKLVK